MFTQKAHKSDDDNGRGAPSVLLLSWRWRWRWRQQEGARRTGAKPTAIKQNKDDKDDDDKTTHGYITEDEHGKTGGRTAKKLKLSCSTSRTMIAR